MKVIKSNDEQLHTENTLNRMYLNFSNKKKTTNKQLMRLHKLWKVLSHDH